MFTSRDVAWAPATGPEQHSLKSHPLGHTQNHPKYLLVGRQKSGHFQTCIVIDVKSQAVLVSSVRIMSIIAMLSQQPVCQDRIVAFIVATVS